MNQRLDTTTEGPSFSTTTLSPVATYIPALNRTPSLTSYQQPARIMPEYNDSISPSLNTTCSSHTAPAVLEPPPLPNPSQSQQNRPIRHCYSNKIPQSFHKVTLNNIIGPPEANSHNQQHSQKLWSFDTERPAATNSPVPSPSTNDTNSKLDLSHSPSAVHHVEPFTSPNDKGKLHLHPLTFEPIAPLPSQLSPTRHQTILKPICGESQHTIANPIYSAQHNCEYFSSQQLQSSQCSTETVPGMQAYSPVLDCETSNRVDRRSSPYPLSPRGLSPRDLSESTANSPTEPQVKYCKSMKRSYEETVISKSESELCCTSPSMERISNHHVHDTSHPSVDSVPPHKRIALNYTYELSLKGTKSSESPMRSLPKCDTFTMNAGETLPIPQNSTNVIHRDQASEAHPCLSVRTNLLKENIPKTAHGQVGDSYDQESRCAQLPLKSILTEGKMNSPNTTYTCAHCAERFSSVQERKVHIREVHEKRFPCHVCPSRFTRRYDLNKHYQIVHKKVRPFVCDLCGSCFGQKHHLIRHKRALHMKAKDFACQLCPAKFSRDEHLHNHTRSVHGMWRPHICSLCDMQLPDKRSLKSHIETVHQVKSTRSGIFVGWQHGTYKSGSRAKGVL